MQAAALYSSRHPWWASLTLAFPVLALIGAATSVVVGRFRSGNPMSCAKFTLLTLRLESSRSSFSSLPSSYP